MKLFNLIKVCLLMFMATSVYANSHALFSKFDFSTIPLEVVTDELELNSDDIVVTADCEGYSEYIYPDAFTSCSTSTELEVMWKFDFDADNQIDYPLEGWDTTSFVSAYKTGVNHLPIGTHQIFWVINDDCGNEQTAVQLLIIEPEKDPPFAFCYDGVASVYLGQQGTSTVFAEDFNAGCTDACGGDVTFTIIPEVELSGLTDEQALQLSFEHDNVVELATGNYGFTFNCDYWQSWGIDTFTVRINVIDQHGNFAFCTSRVLLVDNSNGCNSLSDDINVIGMIVTEQGEPVELVELELDANFPEFPLNLTTSEDGLYSFESVFEGVNYQLNLQRDDDYLNGITTFDMILIQKHILSLEVITSPYTLIAADVNNDCVVTGGDIVQLRSLVLGKYVNDELPDNNSWKFIQHDFEFDSGEQPCDYPQSATFVGMEQEHIFDFYGVKVGDINASVQANAVPVLETRTNINVPFTIDDSRVRMNEVVEVPIYAKDFLNVHGFQLTLETGDMEIQSIESGVLTLQSADYRLVTPNKLAISYINAEGITIANDLELFTIVLRSKVNSELSTQLKIDENGLDPQIYLRNDLDICNLIVQFREGNNAPEEGQFILFQNTPNPVVNTTNIGFVLPETREATITIYDITGKTIFSKTAAYAKGENRLTVDANKITSLGVFYYTLESGEHYATKKMVVIQ